MEIYSESPPLLREKWLILHINTKRRYMDYGFVRVAAMVPRVNVADCWFNSKEICEQMLAAGSKGAKIIVFPEMSVTAYTCGDLFFQQELLVSAEVCLDEIRKATEAVNAIVFVGMPVRGVNAIYNCAVALCRGHILGAVPKTYLPNYNEFYEKRWFASSKSLTQTEVELCGETVPMGCDLLFKWKSLVIASEICEDLWTAIPPSSYAALAGANVIVNLSASNEVIGKHGYLCSLVKQQSARCMAAYVYSSAGFGESSTDLVFAGNAIVAENGTFLAQSERFTEGAVMAIADIDIEKINSDRRATTSYTDCMAFNRQSPYRTVNFVLDETGVENELMRPIHRYPFVPADGKLLSNRCEEIINIQASGLARRLSAIGCKNVVIGISGGLDSTLALLVTAMAFDRLKLPRTGIVGITMPGFGTTGRTYANAMTLMQALGITVKEISIKAAVEMHFSDIGHDQSVQDVVYENSQARERTQILMDYSNKVNGIVVGTGDLSELALGWATYNGDHMSMYGVNAGIPKTLVKYLVRWFADIYFAGNESISPALHDIVDTPISPELIPAEDTGEIKQKTEDLVGPYDLHDFFLYYMLRYGFSPRKIYWLASRVFMDDYDDVTIKKWLKTFVRRFFNQQFKRSCMPDGPKVGSVSLSPRGDWRMPSDATSALWIKECDEL